MVTFVLAMLLGAVLAIPLEYCRLSEVWGDASYLNKSNCETMDLQLKATSLTMSGFSHGGYLTANLFTMFNENIDGIAINAGHGPCANAGYACTDEEKKPKHYSSAGIKGKPVFLYSGVNDTSVKNEESQETADYFESLGANVTRRWIRDFAHIFPNSVQTNEHYNPPTTCAKWIENLHAAQNCGYNLALEIFQNLYGGNLSKDYNYLESGSLLSVDTTPFQQEGSFISDQSFLYVPKACFNESCRLHVDFHGCQESNVWWNDTFVRALGYMEHAAASNIIMLFPNSNDTVEWHCWRSAGMDDSQHPQIIAIIDLIKGLFGRDLVREGVESSAKPKATKASQVIELQTKMFGQFSNPLLTFNKDLNQHIHMRKGQENQKDATQSKSFLLF